MSGTAEMKEVQCLRRQSLSTEKTQGSRGGCTDSGTWHVLLLNLGWVEQRVRNIRPTL